MSIFFAYLNRMRLIRRWGLMRCTQPENDAEHSLQVAMLAHGLAMLARDRYGREVDPNHVLAMAVYHDASEVLTGDMPTPIKYHDAELKQAYGRMEELATRRLREMAPADLREALTPYLMPEEDYAWKLVKAADKMSAYVKCLEEQRAGNHEFDAAQKSILAWLRAVELPEVQDFFDEFIPAFGLSLDELKDAEETLK